MSSFSNPLLDFDSILKKLTFFYCNNNHWAKGKKVKVTKINLITTKQSNRKKHLESTHLQKHMLEKIQK
jgi:hypothetical protein